MSTSLSEQQFFWLLKKSRELFAARELTQVVEQTTQTLRDMCGVERCLLYWVDSDTHKLTQIDGPPDLLGSLNHRFEQDTRVYTRVQQVFRDQVAFLDIPDVSALPPPGAQSANKFVLCLPMSNADHIMGVLYADGKSVANKPIHPQLLELWTQHVAAACDNARLFERASNDLLTGLPNNSYLMSHFAKLLNESSKLYPGGLLLIDLDEFKRVNQAAGAHMGDKALIDIAHTLREVLRADGLVARFGSDKFAVLLAPDKNTPIALRLHDVAERTRATVVTKNYHGVQLSACVGGIAFAKEFNQSTPDWVAKADNMLSIARARGQGQVEINTEF